MTTTYLLDINLLLALSDPQHVHHEVAHRWFAETGHAAWATCPITENGFVRVASNPAYPNRPGSTPAVVGILGELCRSEGHRFWSDDISLCDLLEAHALLTHTQITDAYLLGLASHHGGRLATFDQNIPCNAVRGGVNALELIIP
jgi:uncharacterized protein